MKKRMRFQPTKPEGQNSSNRGLSYDHYRGGGINILWEFHIQFCIIKT